ncbi:MAG: hypothetical protein LAC69_08445 [Chlorobium sp.]|nr:hypothetical protein [Chlorobium sp.]
MEAKLIPEFQHRKLAKARLEVKGAGNNTITWVDILAIIADSDIDAFTRNALDQLKKYSNGQRGASNSLQEQDRL